MGRSIFIAIFLLGFFTSMLNKCAPRMSSGHPDHAFAVAGDSDSSAIATHGSTSGSGFNDGSTVELQRHDDGHFYADVEINGTPVTMLIDTGATGIALSRDDARSAGIATSIGMNDVVGEGADGSVHGEYVTIDRMRLGSASANGLEAIVLNSGEQSLLGQEFLAKFDSVEIHGDTMALK